MVAGVPRVAPAARVGRVRELLAGEDALAVAVVDGDRLVSLIPVADLFAAADDAPVTALASKPWVQVTPDAPIEPAAQRLVDTGASLIGVCDGGQLLGVVPERGLTRALLIEHDEDLARIGGYRSSARTARTAAEEPLGRRLWHRLPWLLVGLIGAMASAVLVGAFEAELNDVVLLAFFVPAVVYIADSVGTQTETLLIRALAVEVHLGTVVRRELLTGVLLGTVVGALFYPFAVVGWGDADVALGVSLALFCSCSIATAVAMALPIALGRLGFDPAFGSGPLATVLQDLLSIAIYFAIAVPLAT
jgi:magnesium transporter